MKNFIVFFPFFETFPQSYENECYAQCDGSQVECEGLCPCFNKSKLMSDDNTDYSDEDCDCPKEKEGEGVCGGNGKFYNNSCLMNCAGVEEVCDDCDCGKYERKKGANDTRLRKIAGLLNKLKKMKKEMKN